MPDKEIDFVRDSRYLKPIHNILVSIEWKSTVKWKNKQRRNENESLPIVCVLSLSIDLKKNV